MSKRSNAVAGGVGGLFGVQTTGHLLTARDRNIGMKGAQRQGNDYARAASEAGNETILRNKLARAYFGFAEQTTKSTDTAHRYQHYRWGGDSFTAQSKKSAERARRNNTKAQEAFAEAKNLRGSRNRQLAIAGGMATAGVGLGALAGHTTAKWEESKHHRNHGEFAKNGAPMTTPKHTSGRKIAAGSAALAGAGYGTFTASMAPKVRRAIFHDRDNPEHVDIRAASKTMPNHEYFHAPRAGKAGALAANAGMLGLGVASGVGAVNHVRNKRKVNKAFTQQSSLQPKPRSVRRKTALGVGIGTYVGGSKAFGTRAAAGEALDWSQHFAAKFPKAGPALGKVDRVATAAHNLPRGPLLTTGLVGGAALGGAVEHHRATKVAKGTAEEITKATRRPKVKEKVSRTKQALAHMSITPEQARHATVLGQVGSSAGTVAGSAAGALMGIKGKKVAAGMGIGAGVGAAFGGGVGASLGLYSGAHHHDGVLKRAPTGQTDSQKWERRTANGLNVVGGAADAYALKTGYQATKNAFKTGRPQMDKLALPMAVTGIAAAGVNAHLINHKKKETTVAKNDYDVEEVFKLAHETKMGAGIGALAGFATRGRAGVGTIGGAIVGGGAGALVAANRKHNAAQKKPVAKPVAKRDYDVDEIFKLSRDAKTGAGIGLGYSGFKSAKMVRGAVKTGMHTIPGVKTGMAVGGAAGAIGAGAIGAAAGGAVHHFRKPKAPKVPDAPQA